MLLLTPSISGLFKWRQFEPEVILLVLAKALGRQSHPVPRVINTDGHSAYPPAIVRLKAEGALDEGCRDRPVPYPNNVLEQDHRAIKRRGNASQHFRSFWAAWRTIAGYEAIHMIRKGQACWNAAEAKVGLLHRFILALFAATANRLIQRYIN
jgi:transposase-like protein